MSRKSRRSNTLLKNMRYDEILKIGEKGLCPYIREVEVYGNYIVGECSRTRKTCEGNLPQICEVFK